MTNPCQGISVFWRWQTLCSPRPLHIIEADNNTELPILPRYLDTQVASERQEIEMRRASFQRCSFHVSARVCVVPSSSAQKSQHVLQGAAVVCSSPEALQPEPNVSKRLSVGPFDTLYLMCAELRAEPYFAGAKVRGSYFLPVTETQLDCDFRTLSFARQKLHEVSDSTAVLGVS